MFKCTTFNSYCTLVVCNYCRVSIPTVIVLCCKSNLTCAFFAAVYNCKVTLINSNKTEVSCCLICTCNCVTCKVKCNFTCNSDAFFKFNITKKCYCLAVSFINSCLKVFVLNAVNLCNIVLRPYLYIVNCDYNICLILLVVPKSVATYRTCCKACSCCKFINYNTAFTTHKTCIDFDSRLTCNRCGSNKISIDYNKFCSLYCTFVVKENRLTCTVKCTSVKCYLT